MKFRLIWILLLLLLVGCQQEVADGSPQDDAGKMTANVKSDGESKDSEKHSNHDKENRSKSSVDEDLDSTDEGEKEELTSLSKNEYIRMLDDIENSFSNLHEELENGSQLEMNQAIADIYKKWDDALNEIYGALWKQLSAEEMNQLREKQREWIDIRDEKAREEAADFAGGTLESFVYISTQNSLTKARCYELVELYMN